MAAEHGKLFHTYIWGKNGIADALRVLNHEDYGTDLIRILFKFYLNPIPYELANLKEMESYRKQEKSIGIPIIVNEDNFFSRSEAERRSFLKQAILEKLCLLEERSKKRKLETDIGKLKQDVETILH
jgi:hypothetical protein